MTEAIGFLVIDKPRGWTSHDTVAKVRRGTGIRRVGHAGTLDPMATGILVLCIGAATRLSEYVMTTTKTYEATICLGIETETYDAEGRIVSRGDPQAVRELTYEQILNALVQGEQDQVPPMYSAIKQGGQKLYDLARRGQTVVRTPRRVWIQSRIIAFDPPNVQLSIECSAGTYIRSIAHDLGAALGVGGHLTALRRTRSGTLTEPLAWQALAAAFADGSWPRYLIDERRALAHIPELLLDETQARAVLHGQSFSSEPEPIAGELRRAYTPNGRFIAIVAARNGRWQPEKVFEGR